MVTLENSAPLPGENEVSFGSTLKVELLNALPPGFVTPTVPVTSVATDENVVAGVPLKVTAVAPLRFVPVTFTIVPGSPLVGKKLEIAGTGTKSSALVATPYVVVTVIGPEGAVDGTVAVSSVSLTGVKDAETPANSTFVGESRWMPVMVTSVPAVPDIGEKP